MLGKAQAEIKKIKLATLELNRQIKERIKNGT
jgi:hypothetical protein